MCKLRATAKIPFDAKQNLVPSYLGNLNAAYPNFKMLISQGTFMLLLARAVLSRQMPGDNGGHAW